MGTRLCHSDGIRCVCVALPEPLYLLLAAGLLLFPVQPPQVVCRLAVARTALPPEDILTVDTGYYCTRDWFLITGMNFKSPG